MHRCKINSKFGISDIARFEQSLAHILRDEGGFVDHPNDPGGATNMGITRKTLARWRRIRPWWDLPKTEVRTLASSEVAAIYRALYWDRCRASLLAHGLDYALFDFAVNSGPARAIQTLQAIVGSRQDGIVGTLTLKAVREKIDRAGVRALITSLCRNRLNFLTRLSTYSTFGRGWRKRVADVQFHALAAAGENAIPQVDQRRSPMNILAGYKTYIVAAAMLIAGLGQLLGIDLPGFNDQSSGQLIIEALAVLFLRRGIKTEIANA